jgi:hypothetical protein
MERQRRVLFRDDPPTAVYIVDHMALYRLGNCVEVADTTEAVMVRDTTDRAGAVLNVSAEAWKRFTTSIK